MDLSFTKSQELLLKSAKDFLEKECKDIARESEDTDDGYSPLIWKKMAELGWLGIVIPEMYGGLDGDILELIILIQQMGRVLLPGPFLPTAICSSILLEYGTKLQKERLLPEISDGKAIVIPAVIEPLPFAGKADGKDMICIKDECFTVSGTRLFVPFAHTADWFVFKICKNDEMFLFLVDSKSDGVKVTMLESLASDKLCEVVLENVKIPRENLIDDSSQGVDMIKKFEEAGSICHSAYLLGMLEKILEITVDYAKSRVQFNKPIGSFQAIQHQCANMSIAVEQVKYLTYFAAWKLSKGLPAIKEVAMAKARASDAAREVSLIGVKVHGGIGVIDEYDMQLYFRRAKAAELSFGDGAFHREVIAGNIGL